jgi:hypothetical protein
MRSPLAAVAALVLVLAAAAAAPAGTSRGADQKVTASGVGKVPLGGTFRSLRASGLLGKLRSGCPLAGPNAKAASLRAPLKGFVDLTKRRPRKVRAITVTGGATARGVAVGDQIADVKAAYPKAKVDHDTEDVFDVTLVKVPNNGGGRIQFAVDVGSKKITQIAVPAVQFCE